MKKSHISDIIIKKEMFNKINSSITNILTKTSLVLLIILVGCNSDELEISRIKTETYLKKYMDYPSQVYPAANPSYTTYINCNSDNMSNDSISICYENNTIVKRIGYFLLGNSNAGFPSIFTRDIYDTLIYTNNQLTFLTKSTSQIIKEVENKVIYYENEQISKTIQLYQYSDNQYVTVYYTYNNGLLTKKTGYIGANLNFQSDFYYNKNANLDSIVSRRSQVNTTSDKFEIDFSSKKRIKEVFENYDNTKNQTKSLIIFDEFFNRSLSANNYGKYSYYYFDSDGIILNEWHFTYNLKYENGAVNFAK